MTVAQFEPDSSTGKSPPTRQSARALVAAAAGPARERGGRARGGAAPGRGDGHGRRARSTICAASSPRCDNVVLHAYRPRRMSGVEVELRREGDEVRRRPRPRPRNPRRRRRHPESLGSAFAGRLPRQLLPAPQRTRARHRAAGQDSARRGFTEPRPLRRPSAAAAPPARRRPPSRRRRSVCRASG